MVSCKIFLLIFLLISDCCFTLNHYRNMHFISVTEKKILCKSRRNSKAHKSSPCNVLKKNNFFLVCVKASEWNISDILQKLFKCIPPIKRNNLYGTVVVGSHAVTDDWRHMAETEKKNSKLLLELIQLKKCVKIRRQHFPYFWPRVGK